MEKEDALLVGPQAVREALRAAKPIDKVWFLHTSARRARLQLLLKELAAAKVPCVQAPQQLLQRLAGPRHQGVVARVAVVGFEPLSEVLIRVFERGEAPLVLLVERCTDVRNVGAMARSAEALGADALLIGQKGAAAMGGAAMRASAGALLHLPVCRIANFLKDGIAELHAHGLKIVAASADAKKSCHEVDLSVPLALLVGAEGQGLGPGLLAAADEQVRVPMQGKTESLNVSAAAAILLYEAHRQRAEQH